MKINELSALLEDCDPDAEVVLAGSEGVDCFVADKIIDDETSTVTLVLMTVESGVDCDVSVEVNIDIEVVFEVNQVVGEDSGLTVEEENEAEDIKA